jgi:hypothetical protein
MSNSKIVCLGIETHYTRLAVFVAFPERRLEDTRRDAFDVEPAAFAVRALGSPGTSK